MADYKDQGLYQEGNSLFDDIFAFGDLEVQNVNVLGIITATTFSGVDATSLKDNAGTVQIQATTTGATHSGRAVFNEVELQGKVYDSDGDFGTSGQVLSSDGTDINWVNAGSLSAGAAALVAVTSTNSGSHFLSFVDSVTGNEDIRANSSLTYNTATQVITGRISSIDNHNTGSLSEGSNLYYTNARVISAIASGFTVSGIITATTFDGNVTGNVTGNTNGTHTGAVTGNVTGNINGQLTGAIQTAAQTNITSVGTLTGLTVDGNLILDNTSNYIHIKGALYDKDGQSGSNGEVLVSTGSQVDWQNPNTLTASNSIKITITENDTNSDFPITFSAAPGQTGGNTLLSDNQFTYNASSNTVTAGTFSGSGASLTSLNASNLGTGTVADARLSNSSLFVQGMIMMYNGSSAPSGWAICDGQNGTPDLRDRFIVGTGSSYSLGNTGGANSVTLTTAQMPSHKHTTSVDNTNLFPSSGQTSIGFGGAGSYPATTFTMNNEGGGQAHENRPPYYALMFIMKL
jgi:microcystin-dependent protein